MQALVDGLPQAPAGPVSVAQLQGQEWVANYIDGIATVKAPAPRLRWTSADQLTGSGGCNAFMGRAVVEQGALKLGPLAATGKIGVWGYIGVVPLLTGIAGHCPVYSVLGIDTCSLRR